MVRPARAGPRAAWPEVLRGAATESLLHRIAPSGEASRVGTIVLVEFVTDRGPVLRGRRLLLAELSLRSQHGDHPADAHAARRSCGGVSLGGAAHRADTGTARRSAF